MDTDALHTVGDDTFWQERRTCCPTTLRPDGTPHTTPAGVTYDPETRIPRVITDGGNKKVRNTRALPRPPAPKRASP